jgi:hypothetical protein
MNVFTIFAIFLLSSFVFFVAANVTMDAVQRQIDAGAAEW